MGLRKFIKKKLGLERTIPMPPFLIESAGNITAGIKSYHNGLFQVKGIGNLSVGNYCAFGNNIKIILSNHNYHYPAIQYSVYRKNFGKLPYKSSPGINSIGHDVWIGDNVVILPNIKIGNGAVIAAGAIVTRDVPDFAIVGGNPAKIIKFRFNEKQINYLNEKQWWNWSEEQIKENKDFFFSIPLEK